MGTVIWIILIVALLAFAGAWGDLAERYGVFVLNANQDGQIAARLIRERFVLAFRSGDLLVLTRP